MQFLTIISNAVWGLPTVFLILGTGFYLTLRLKFPQIRRFKSILKSPQSADNKGSAPTPFRAMATSLAATVGTGSIVGVASAIAVGGPGAVLWLWVSAFFGMAVAYAEGVLSIRFRRENPREGGIWIALEKGLRSPKIARIYAIFNLLASLGMGCMTQTGSASAALSSEFSLKPEIVGIFVFILLLLCLFGRGIAGRLCELGIPFFAGFYVLGAALIIFHNISELPGVFCHILRSALGFRQAAGGFSGYLLASAMSVGFRRGVFSNEAGLGTTAPVHAASATDDPDRQGLMNMLEVMIDTFVICTLTALAILTSGAENLASSDGTDMVINAAESTFGGSSGKLVAISIAAFAIATSIGWSQIGIAAAKYLAPKRLRYYKIIYAACGFAGTLFSLDHVFKISDIFNGLMIFPCLYAIIGLRREIISSNAGKIDKSSHHVKNPYFHCDFAQN